ncbi:MAG: tetratricopeptide repeat protein [bacterium]|nr:tetratricopeptide repeat protein [bacterium]
MVRYRDILNRTPGGDEAVGIQYMIGRILQVKLASFSEALQEYRKIVEGHADHILADSALYNLGVCYEVLGDGARAEMTYLRLIRKYPGSSRLEDARLRLEEISYFDR